MTQDEIMQLDDDALRVEVAKRCGYDVVEKRKDGAWLAFHDLAGYNMRGIEGVPDYPHDLTAAYALEDALPGELRGEYSNNLRRVILQMNNEYCTQFYLIHASADRCRAWLWTMDA